MTGDAPSADAVQWAIRSAVASRSGSMSWRAIAASRRAGEDRMSPRRLRVNSTLPAPTRTILGIVLPVHPVIRTYGRPDVTVAGFAVDVQPRPLRLRSLLRVRV